MLLLCAVYLELNFKLKLISGILKTLVGHKRSVFPGGLDGDVIVNVADDLGCVHVAGVGRVSRDSMVLL